MRRQEIAAVGVAALIAIPGCSMPSGLVNKDSQQVESTIDELVSRASTGEYPEETIIDEISYNDVISSIDSSKPDELCDEELISAPYALDITVPDVESGESNQRTARMLIDFCTAFDDRADVESSKARSYEIQTDVILGNLALYPEICDVIEKADDCNGMSVVAGRYDRYVMDNEGQVWELEDSSVTRAEVYWFPEEAPRLIDLSEKELLEITNLAISPSPDH